MRVAPLVPRAMHFGIEGVETMGPLVVHLCQPRFERRERRDIEPIEPLPSLRLANREAAFPEQPQVTAHSRPADAEVPGDLTDGHRPLPEQCHDLTPDRIGDGSGNEHDPRVTVWLRMDKLAPPPVEMTGGSARA